MSSKRSKSPTPDSLPAGLTEQLLQEIAPLPASPETLARVRRVLMRRVAAEAPSQVSTLALASARFKPYLAGVERAVLQRDAAGETWLLRLAPDATVPEHDHSWGEEWSLVLEGACSVDGQHLTVGDSQFAPQGSHHGAIHSPGGCLLWLRLAKQAAPAASPVPA
jgi:anti-sigma factor ChrR (cupin superfamily)